ncbi:MAG: Asp-tRNA(Asn)/Glu-tRNA(Gln) amidotransferase subunit GatB [Oscillospiraceae bacterium]|nr:Asp-tRNA(Asn)/Glu-tRNA(Gln) amidotransferase subunit GatB [Oscillospiraceae bacterium]
MIMRYETVIGLEVHIELATESKIFCSCSAKFGGEQNDHVCPACCGMPGMLPIVNKHVVDLGMAAGMMLNCDINRVTTFDKKSYYYPDLPCSYQTTQWFAPVSVNGRVDIETSKGKKSIRIKQIHMEEDAGKLVHDDWTNTSLVDFNRTSVPLIEIVSQPDLSSAEEVIAYLERLRSLLRFAKVSECRMEQGSMRCDVNLSVRPEGSDVLGVRTEMKNMNSLSAIARAIEYETARHIDAIENGTEELVQETRRWDDTKGASFAMRNKETAGDYRYFPDPNVMPIVIDDEWFNTVKSNLPEFPEVKKARYIDELGLAEGDAEHLIQSRAFCDCFEGAYEVCGNAKEAANWLIFDCSKILNQKQQTVDQLNISGKALGELIKLVLDEKVSRANAKKILSAMFEEELDPAEYAKANGFIVSNDTGAMESVIAAVIAADPKSVNDYKNGKEKALMALFGKCMKELKGNCNPQVLREMLLKSIENA